MANGNESPVRRPTMEDAAAVVCEHYGVKLEEIRQRRSHPHVTEARWMLWTLGRSFDAKPMSYPAIGMFTKHGHSGIIAAVHETQRRMETDATLANLHRALMHRVRARCFATAGEAATPKDAA